MATAVEIEKKNQKKFWPQAETRTTDLPTQKSDGKTKNDAKCVTSPQWS